MQCVDRTQNKRGRPGAGEGGSNFFANLPVYAATAQNININNLCETSFIINKYTDKRPSHRVLALLHEVNGEQREGGGCQEG